MPDAQRRVVNDSEQVLVSYAFMASLNNGSADLLDDVYMPMFKRAISRYSQQKPGGKDIDAKQAFEEMYGIEVPVYTVRQMLRKLERALSRAQRRAIGFEVFEKGKSFTISDYAFDELEHHYASGSRDTKALHAAFDEYLSNKEIQQDSLPALSEFIKRNTRKLSGFFNKYMREDTLPIGDLGEFEVHAHFFEIIEENNNQLYRVAENLFIGSVIAAYIESGFDFAPKFNSNTTFYLDTQFVLRVLDLQQEEETRPAIEVIEMVNRSGGKLAILDATQKELEGIIQAAIDNFSRNPLIASVNNHSVNHACVRRQITRTDLQNFLAQLEKHLREQVCAAQEKVPKSIVESTKKSREHSDLADTRRTNANAHHDVQCIEYVRRKRSGAVMNYQKANAWFVSSNSNLYMFNLSRTKSGCIPEVITPEELASLLWLQNPSALSDAVARIGLDELVAQALVSNLAPVEALSAFDKNLRKYTNVTPEQYATVAASLAHDSNRSLFTLNRIADEDPSQFSRAVLDIIEDATKKAAETEDLLHQHKSRTAESDEKVKTVSEQNTQLSAKLAAIETQLQATKDDARRIEREQERQEQLRRQMQDQLSAKNWLIFSLAAMLICGLGAWAFLTFVEISWLKSGLAGICSLGGLWGFISMTVNIVRLKLRR